MAVFALLSAGGSPGVTTTALALTLSWPSQVIIAECDPSGGDVLAGLLSGHMPASTGLLPLALEAGAGAEIPTDAIWRQLVELDEEHNRLLLAGISDPRQSAALQSSLPWIAEALQGLQADVIADCGRLDAIAAVRPVLSAASLAVLVLRPTLRQASRAVPRVEMLTSLVGRDRVVALLVGEGAASAREIAKSLGVPVVGQLPDDGRTAAVLSDGSGSRSRLDGRPLLRSATAAGRALRDAAEAAGPLHGYAEQTVYSVTGPELGGPQDSYYAPGGGAHRAAGGGQHTGELYAGDGQQRDPSQPPWPRADSPRRAHPPPRPPSLPGQYAPGRHSPDSLAPDSYAPDAFEPDSFAPGLRALPGQAGQPALRGEALPGQAFPGEAVRGEAPPGQAYPGEAVHGQTPPGQAYPGEPVPGQTPPRQPLPAQQYRGQPLPSDPSQPPPDLFPPGPRPAQFGGPGPGPAQGEPPGAGRPGPYGRHGGTGRHGRYGNAQQNGSRP
jgi:hypothetical protein